MPDDGDMVIILEPGLRGPSGDFTPEQVQDVVAALIVAGANISATYDDTANTLTLAVTGLTQAVQDIVGALPLGGAGITATYDGMAHTLTLDVNVDGLTLEIVSDMLRVKAGSITPSHLSFDPATQSELDTESATRLAADALLVPLSQKGAANGVATLDGSSLIPDGQIPPGIARDSETTAAVAAEAASRAAADALLIPLTQKAAANGVATLGSDSKVPSAQIPAIAITDTFVVASQAAMLALTAQTGDVAVRTDTSTTYILKGTDPTQLSDWELLRTPADAVLSVNGQTGAVTISAAGLGALVAANNLSDLTNASTARTNLGLGTAATHATTDYDAAGAAAAAQAASQPLDSDLTAIAALTTTAFGRSFLDRADAAAGRTLLGLGTAATSAATDFDAAGAAAAAQAASQPLDSDLTAIAALSTTAYGRSLLTLANLAALQAILGTGTPSASNFLRGDGTWAVPPLDKLGLIPTAVKTANYTASAGDLVPCDTSGGTFTLTLPTAPADGSVVAIKVITAGNTLNLALGGSDVFNKTGGSATGTLSYLNQAILLQYKASGAIWYVVADDLPKSALDTIYASTTDSRLSDARTPTGAAGGDLTGTYPNPTIGANKVTNSLLAQMANATVKGRNTAGTGNSEDVTMAQLSTLLGLGSLATLNAVGSAQITDGTVALADLANLANATIIGRNTAGTGVPEAVTMAQLRSLLALSASDVSGAAQSQVDVYTAGTSTWTKPTWAKKVDVYAIGAGGGGGSGRKGAATSIRCGGGGGGGAVFAQATLKASDLGATVNVQVGAGGAGGAAQATNSTSGNAGSNGGDSYFGAAKASNLVSAPGGLAGQGGTATTGTQGNGGTGFWSGSNGAAASTTGAVGNAASGGTGATGGGSGGGITALEAASAGGASSAPLQRVGFTATGGGAIAGGGSNGSNQGSSSPGPGSGGGGGGSSLVGNAGGGGNGVVGGGGGGGGASLDSTGNSGAGGNGGDGLIVVVSIG